jgi:hypothetical protein
MKAILISGEKRTLEAIDIDGRDAIARLIGFDTIESDAVGADGDRLYFDEECFLRGSGGRFQVDNLIPISGKAVIVGTTGNGAVLCNATSELESLRGRIKYL